MAEKIKYIFTDFSKEGIEMELRRILDEAVVEKYGKMPNEVIRKRIKEEWHAIEGSDLVLDIAAMYEIVQWLKEYRHPYWMRGCTGSSFVRYMLGIPPEIRCRRTFTVPIASLLNSSPITVMGSISLQRKTAHAVIV